MNTNSMFKSNSRLPISRARRVLLHAGGQPVVQVLLEELLSRQRGPQSQKGERADLKFRKRDIIL